MNDDVWQAPGRGAAPGDPPAHTDRWRGTTPGRPRDGAGTAAGVPAPHDPYATPTGDVPGRYPGPYAALTRPGTAGTQDPFAMSDRHHEQVLGAAGYTTPAYRNDSVAVTSLVLGIIGIIVPGVFLFAIAAGHLALRRLRTSYEGGRGLAVAGLVLGYVMLALWASLLLLVLSTRMLFGL